MKAALAIACLAVASCGRPPPARPAVPFDTPRGIPVDVALYGPDGGGSAMGLAGPLDVIRIARDGSWAVVCQSLFDTNMDGETWGSCRTLAVVRDGGGPRSDRRTTSLIVGSGPGVEIESLVAVSPDERYLVVLFEFTRYLVDTTARTATYLPFLDGEAVFTQDSRRLIYSTHEGLAVHDLGDAGGFLVAVEGPSPSIVEVEPDGHHVRLATGGALDSERWIVRRIERRFDLGKRSFVGAPVEVELPMRLELQGYVVPQVADDRLVFATDDRGRRLVAFGTPSAALGPLVWEDP